MLSKTIFFASHLIADNSFYSKYRYVTENQWKSYEDLKCQQEQQLKIIINYAYEHVPYYRKLFDMLGLSPQDIRHLEDLQKLPILNRNTVMANWEDFKPINLQKIKYHDRATGGSTGTPLKYRITKYDRFLGCALLYRGWGYGGYSLGDKMIFLGGTSLDIGRKSKYYTILHELARNLRKLSSFDMSETDMQNYADIFNSINPNYLRGYAYSIYIFSKWIDQKNIKIAKPKAIFTTSEKLYPKMRETIQNTFRCPVYDTYGLNDGGVSAYECQEHCGMHIDTERGIMEVVGPDGNNLVNGQGEIIATSLYNYAMPLIRYNTEDIAWITDDVCKCGRKHKMLKEVVGRSIDFLETPSGTNVHGMFFIYIFWEYCKGIKEYQVIQKTIKDITIKIVPNTNFDKNQLDKIRDIVKKRGIEWKINFELIDEINRSISGKYKFIVNEMQQGKNRM